MSTAKPKTLKTSDKPKTFPATAKGAKAATKRAAKIAGAGKTPKGKK